MYRPHVVHSSGWTLVFFSLASFVHSGVVRLLGHTLSWVPREATGFRAQVGSCQPSVGSAVGGRLTRVQGWVQEGDGELCGRSSSGLTARLTVPFQSWRGKFCCFC